MSITDLQFQTWLAAVFWPFLRVGAMVMSAPVFNSRQVPMRIRLMLALVLTLVIVPTLPPLPVTDIFGYQGLMVALQQLFVGVAMGFVLQMVFNAVVFGGQIIANKMGLGFASLVDPSNGVSVPVLSQYYLVFATLTFLWLNGHLVLIEVLADSFRTLPVAMDGIGRTGVHDIVAWASRMFAGGLLLALPAVASLLLVNLSFGIVTRAAPQLNIFAVGFPVTMLMGLGLIWVTLPQVLDNFTGLMDEGLRLLMKLLSITR